MYFTVIFIAISRKQGIEKNDRDLGKFRKI